jgi:lipopolysaccharide/colanic/teichoic acid biosynthesis glycosyltransferase
MYTPFKRTIDIIISITGLVILFPFFAVIAVAIILDSKGGVFFRHNRVGKACSVFGMVKFRSMVKDAHNIGPYWTADNDPRITKVGAFLRKTSLDELPQLWNVLVGDMSLVGVRPDTPAQEKEYPPHMWYLRHKLKPGITGMAQAFGRSGLTPHKRMAYDRFYVRHASLWLDCIIVIRTAKLVLLREGTN